MGLGKTLQALSVAYCYKEEWPLLIIVPSSLRYPWIEELEKWFPNIQPGDVHLVNSGTDVGAISTCKVCLIGYGLMRNDSKTLLETLHKQQFQVIVVDESHYLKNLKAARTKVLLPLLKKAKRLLLLTGTPALARPAELFPQLDCLQPGLFGTWTTFTKRFCGAGWRYFGRNKTWDTSGASNLEELHNKLKSTVLIRREKKNVLHQLPPKQRQKVPFDLADSDQRQDLEKHWKDLHSLINDDVADDRTRSNTTFEIRKLISQLYIQTGRTKIGAVCDYISMMLDNPGLKFLVFAHHKDVLTAICQTIMKHNREKKEDVQYIRIDGDVPSLDRMHLVKKFQQEEQTRVAVLSIQAAGVGLTFTAATDVVFAELHWTPGVLEQCEDRAHRIGQVNSIHVHYLIAKGSIDEWMWAALSRKVNVVSSALNGKLQHLKASVCDKDEIEFLNFATVWVPSKDEEDNDDDECYFSKEEKKTQDIRSFFTPGETKKKNIGVKSVSDIATTKPDPKFAKQPLVNAELMEIGKTLENSDSEDTFIASSSKSVSSSQYEPVNKRKCTNNLQESDSVTQLDKFNNTSKKTSVDKCQTSGTVSSWSCSLCTFRNHKDLPFCEMCNTAKPVPKKQTPKMRIKKLSKRLSFGNIDFGDDDLEDFYVPPKIKNSLSTTKRSRGIKRKVKSFANSMEVVDNSVVTPYANHVTTFEGEQLPQNKDLVCIDRNSTTTSTLKCFSGESNHQTGDHLNTDSPDSEPTETDTSILEDIAAAESWITSQTSTKLSQELWTCDCGFASQSDECDSCWNPKPSKKISENNFDSKTENNEKQLFESSTFLSSVKSYISSQSTSKLLQESWNPKPLKTIPGNYPDSKTNNHEKQQSSNTDYKIKNVPNSINSERSFIAPSKKETCEIKSLPEVKDELDESNTAHRLFKYRVSPHTNRIYLYNEDGEFLQTSFFSIDVHIKNLELLPEVLQHPSSFKIVQRFVRQWNRLTLPQKKQVSKLGQIFINPEQIFLDIKKKRKQNPSTKRFITKDDLANSALTKANEIGGSLRIISKPFNLSKRKNIATTISVDSSIASTSLQESSSSLRSPTEDCMKSPPKSFISPAKSSKSPVTSGSSPNRGLYLQAVDSKGCALCIFCNQLCQVTKESSHSAAWDRRYCSEKCKDEHKMQGKSSSYIRQQLFQLEHGICQICGLDTHQLFVQIRNLPKSKRKEFLEVSKYSSLSVAELNKIIKSPSEGQFWHADHIIAVADGGGLCSLDNFRTLCVMCHLSVTANQIRDRSTARKTSGMRDISSFFKPI
ncbi:DNA annealing helicase and endonuclease ZRANB3-like [Antedon mediterranea]|uniref:DNA annealing helicase and endonuclease ZRANB3-like n=1 Tax=Antedon mediterranea TaxID=105859 RepID=UPI003AF88319